MCDLNGKHVFLVIGHEPGGGAPKERDFNIAVADIAAKKLRKRGAEVTIYHHQTRAYTQRCREMREAALIYNPDCILLMHYNSFYNPEANGHEFHYNSYPHFAGCIRDAWQARYPWSAARRDNGIMKNTKDAGSKMIKFAPAPACLTEPFFRTNPKEHNILFTDHEGVADVYAEGIANFLLK